MHLSGPTQVSSGLMHGTFGPASRVCGLILPGRAGYQTG
jgi:hypothetical protein